MHMKLLYIIPYVPFPLDSGGNQAFFTLADHVRNQYDLSVLLYAHHKKEMEYIEELKKLWPNVTFHIFDDVARHKEREQDYIDFSTYEGMTWKERKSCQFFQYLRNSMNRKIKRHINKANYRKTISVTDATAGCGTDLVKDNSTLFKHTKDLTLEFCDFVRETADKDFDVIQVEFYEYLPIVYLLPPKAKKIFVHHEIRFVRNENEIQLFQKPLTTDRLRLEEEKALELGALSAYDAIITLTDIDKKILSKYIPEEKIYSSPAITHVTPQELKSFKPASELVFIGSGSHFPNADGMVWFCKEVVPALLRKGIQLPIIHVTGKWEDGMMNIMQAACPTIHFAGYIEDLPSFLNGKISIVPIRIGSGMRMKILDSVFAAAPLVTTAKGCEGLPFVNGENCLIADTAEEFSEAVTRVLSNQHLQEQIALNAQSTKTGMLNEETLFQKRIGVYHALLGC